MATATAMYHSGKIRSVRCPDKDVPVVKSLEQRRLHKAFLRYHDANNWPILRDALRRMGREDLIGNSKHHLVPDLAAGGNRNRARRPSWQARCAASATTREPSQRKKNLPRPSHAAKPSRPPKGMALYAAHRSAAGSARSIAKNRLRRTG